MCVEVDLMGTRCPNYSVPPEACNLISRNLVWRRYTRDPLPLPRTGPPPFPRIPERGEGGGPGYPGLCLSLLLNGTHETVPFERCMAFPSVLISCAGGLGVPRSGRLPCLDSLPCPDSVGYSHRRLCILSRFLSYLFPCIMVGDNYSNIVLRRKINFGLRIRFS